MVSKQECLLYQQLNKLIEVNGHNNKRKLHLTPTERSKLIFIGDVLFLWISILISVVAWHYYTEVAHSYILQISIMSFSLKMSWIILPWIIISLIIDTYSFHHIRTLYSALIGPCKVAFFVSIFYSILYFFAPVGKYPRIVFLFFCIFSCSFLILWRLLYFFIFSQKKLQERLFLIGHSDLFEPVVQIIQENHLYYKIVGNAPNCTMSNDVTEKCEHCLEYQKISDITDNIDKVIFAIDNPISQDFLNFLIKLCEKGIPIIPMPLFYEQLLQRTPVRNMKGWYLSFLPLNEIPTSFFYNFVKRILDIFASSLGLLCFGMIFPILAIIVKISSPGPLFFSQMRVGKYGKPFRLWKLRTMYYNTEKDAMWTLQSDDRITKPGRWLRKLHVDELPQLWNVLKGDLSIVGIRPLSVEQCEKFAEVIPFHNLRHISKPGLTGWAIVNFKHVNDMEGAKIRLEYDIYYIKYRSFFLDCWIILRTLWIMITLKGL